MNPTEEQEAILNADGRVVRINARAGTGKTSTLRMLSEKEPGRRILYLVFNRKAREDAQEKFPENVDVHTVHSFAYRGEGYRWKDNLGFFAASDLLPTFGRSKISQQLATLSFQFLTFFMNSPQEMLEDGVEAFSQYLSDDPQKIFKKHEGIIVRACREIASAWYRKQSPCPHDFYLKLFHKSKSFARALGRYNLVLVDEAQDLSPIMLDALKGYPGRLVLVGDAHQQIYSFRYAMNAMGHMPCDQEYQLSTSFRFGSAIAGLVTLFIREAKKERDFQIRGNAQRQSLVSISPGIPGTKTRIASAILSRTNLALFSNAMQLRSAGRPFRFERDLQPVLYRILDVYRLSQGQKDRIKDRFIGAFGSLTELEEYAEKMDDFPLKGIAQIVKKYGDASFPSVLYEMSGSPRKAGARNDPDSVVLSTVHGAKGQEYGEVFISSDVAESLSASSENDSPQYDEEVNIAYVGFTRAINRLNLPPGFRTLLTDRWKDFLAKYETTPQSGLQRKEPADGAVLRKSGKPRGEKNRSFPAKKETKRPPARPSRKG